MQLIQNEIIIPNSYKKHNVIFLDDKSENLIDVGDLLIPVHVKTRGIDDNLMSMIEVR